jgi:hypothetical protein
MNALRSVKHMPKNTRSMNVLGMMGLSLLCGGQFGCGVQAESIDSRVADSGTNVPSDAGGSTGENQRCAEENGAEGDQLWTRGYFNPDVDVFTTMNQIASEREGLVVSGTMGTNGGSAGWVAKLGDDRAIEWEDFVLPSTAECRILPLRDGDLFAGCTTTVDCPPGVNYHDCDRDILFRRYAPNGEVRWEDLFSGEPNKGNDGTSGGFVELTNGEVVVPYDLSMPSGSSDSSIGHLRAYGVDGQQLWDKEVVVSPYSSVNLSSLVGTEDGRFLYVRVGSSNEQAAIVKLDTSGEVKWATPTQEGRSLYKVGVVGNGVAAIGSEEFEEEQSGVVEVFSSDGASKLVKHFSAGEGGRATANAVAGTREGRLFVAVTAEAATDTVSTAYVVELGPEGEELWRAEGFGPSLTTIVNLAISGSNCSLLAAGRRWEEIQGQPRDVAFGAEISL